MIAARSILHHVLAARQTAELPIVGTTFSVLPLRGALESRFEGSGDYFVPLISSHRKGREFVVKCCDESAKGSKENHNNYCKIFQCNHLRQDVEGLDARSFPQKKLLFPGLML